MLSALLIAGCLAPTGESGAADSGSPDSGSPDSGSEDSAADTGTPAVPDWTEADLPAALTAAVGDGLPSPKRVRDVYFATLASGADGACPGSEQLDGANPLGCTSAQGWFFAGFSSWLEIDLGDGDEWMLSGDFVILEPDGTAFEVGGHALHRLQGSGDWTSYRTEFSGTWHYEGQEGWLGEGTSSLLRTEGTRDNQGERLRLDGGITVHGTSLYFEGVEQVPAECGGLWQGVLSARDPTGAWWSVALDGTCTGCGALTFAGQDRGEACLDLNGLAAAQSAEFFVP